MAVLCFFIVIGAVIVPGVVLIRAKAEKQDLLGSS
jgi:hypothetical protein